MIVTDSQRINFIDETLSLPTDIPCVVLETGRYDENNTHSFVFSSYKDELILDSPHHIDKFFYMLETYLRKGYWLAGFFSYEFGYCLEDTLRFYMPEKRECPLVWLGIFNTPFILNHSQMICVDRKIKNNSYFPIKRIKPKITEQEYKKAIGKIKEYIEKGETYQVNFTFPIAFEVHGKIYELYYSLRQAQPTSYLAFINTQKEYILSFSPELFFSLKNENIVVKPMKGTVARGRFTEEDKYQAQALKLSTKNRAENIMIVDLLRNDLGKIAQTGTVKVKQLFSLEKYRTLWQMTSTIEARLKENISVKDIFKALFPSGSVTGAPKIRTMQIIRELERYPRGVYCGAIGYISPYREMCFNVAIRTLYINKEKRGILGVGGGIVYDSLEKLEYKEAYLKAHFLIKKTPKISLIETIRWDKEGYYLLDMHLERLRNSCEYFDIPFYHDFINKQLALLEGLFRKDQIYKVKIIITYQGDVNCSFLPLERVDEPVLIMLSSKSVNSSNLYLYHKTTYRHFYDEERKYALKKGFWEVIFTNEKGELTEGSITNIFILKDKQLFTPPLSSGLLRGVMREHLLKEKKAREKIMYPQDLFNADKIYIGNSVRKLLEAKLKED